MVAGTRERDMRYCRFVLGQSSSTSNRFHAEARPGFNKCIAQPRVQKRCTGRRLRHERISPRPGQRGFFFKSELVFCVHTTW
jgi:hypothetical protein